MKKQVSSFNRAETEVPEIVVSRLPLYLRALALLGEEGKLVTSSQELGNRLGISSAQIRKDLSHFGEFGKQGTGYQVAFLREQLEMILQLDQVWAVSLIGLGDLGQALLHYGRFSQKGFEIEHVFDSDPEKIGQTIYGIKVRNVDTLETVITDNEIKVAIIAVPLQAAQAVTETLVKGGIKAILNYAPITLSVPEGVKVQNIDPIAHLQKMAYYL